MPGNPGLRAPGLSRRKLAAELAQTGARYLSGCSKSGYNLVISQSSRQRVHSQFSDCTSMPIQPHCPLCSRDTAFILALALTLTLISFALAHFVFLVLWVEHNPLGTQRNVEGAIIPLPSHPMRPRIQ